MMASHTKYLRKKLVKHTSILETPEQTIKAPLQETLTFPEEVGQSQETGHQQEEQHSPKRETRERHVTCRYTQEHGLVYKKDKLVFQPQSTSDSKAIEALNERKRSIKKKIKQSNDYIIVEHIYHVEQVKPQIKIEPFEVKIEDPTEVPLPITPPPSLPPGRYNWRP
jgi:hypothetical protein